MEDGRVGFQMISKDDSDHSIDDDDPSTSSTCFEIGRGMTHRMIGLSRMRFKFGVDASPEVTSRQKSVSACFPFTSAGTTQNLQIVDLPFHRSDGYEFLARHFGEKDQLRSELLVQKMEMATL